MGKTLGWLAATAAAMTAAHSAAQGIPGAIPDPSTYQGSMELQRREQEQQRQNQPQQQYPATTPQHSGSSGPAPQGPPGPPPIDWSKRPPLPAARNPLLGRWHPTEVEQTTNDKDGGLISLLTTVLGGVVQGGCDEIFGRGVLEFRANTLVSVHPDGSEVIKNHVQYRANGASEVVVLPQEPGSIPAVFFTFDGRNRVTASPPGCPMARVGGAGPVLANAPGLAALAKSVLTLQAGIAVPGNFMPVSGSTFYLVTQDPDIALARAGFGGSSPIQAWFQACHADQTRCKAGIAAMTASTVATGRTDAAGNAVLPPLAPGRYYIVGHAAYSGHEVVWHKPIDLQPGPNGAFLDQTNGSVG